MRYGVKDRRWETDQVPRGGTLRCTRLKKFLIAVLPLRIEPTFFGACHTPSRTSANRDRPHSGAQAVAARVSRFSDLATLARAEDTELGVSTWDEMTEEHVAMFAEATRARKWIHRDAERACR